MNTIQILRSPYRYHCIYQLSIRNFRLTSVCLKTKRVLKNNLISNLGFSCFDIYPLNGKWGELLKGHHNFVGIVMISLLIHQIPSLKSANQNGSMPH